MFGLSLIASMARFPESNWGNGDRNNEHLRAHTDKDHACLFKFKPQHTEEGVDLNVAEHRLNEDETAQVDVPADKAKGAGSVRYMIQHCLDASTHAVRPRGLRNHKPL